MTVSAQYHTELRLALFALLCSNLLWILPSSSIITVALALIPQEEQLSWGIRLLWLSFMLVLLVARLFLLKHWLRKPTTAANLRARLNLATTLTALSGCCFGFYGFIGSSPDYPLTSLVIVMIMTGAVGSATAAVSYLLPMYLLFVFPVVIPISVRWISFGDPAYIWTGCLMVLYLALSLGASRNLRASIIKSVELRFENRDLVETLKKEHQRAEIALAREEKANLAKSRFLAAASHDLRQPLHSLRLFTATLELQTRNTEHKTLVSQIDSSAKSLEELFNALLDISKLDAGTVTVHKKHVDLDLVLAQIEREFEAQAKVKNLNFSTQFNGQFVYTDLPLLETMLRNLVGNAIRYTDSGGVTISSDINGNRVCIAVADTGVGIAVSDLEKIFEEFVQVGNIERDRSQGIGLGLYIVKRLADLLDVTLRVESATHGEDRGSRFYVDVPQGEKSKCKHGTITNAQPINHFSSLFVLVIDDEEEACLAIEGLLETWGCLVMCATSGNAALQQLEEIGESPDLVISDYRLRDGETGGDVVTRVRANLGNEVPAIIITGDIASTRLLDIKALGIPLLHKPCEPEALRQLIMRETSQRVATANP